MGLFGKKLKVDDDMPLALTTPFVSTEAPATASTPTPAPVAQSAPASMVTAAPVVAAAPTVAATLDTTPRVPYGIDDAIRLLRSLPVDRNADLVVRVMKQTLESMNVRIADILADADRKEQVAQDQISSFKSDIAELESEIQIRRDEIRRLESELGEATTLRQRLKAAEHPQPAQPAGKIVALG